MNEAQFKEAQWEKLYGARVKTKAQLIAEGYKVREKNNSVKTPLIAFTDEMDSEVGGKVVRIVLRKYENVSNSWMLTISQASGISSTEAITEDMVAEAYRTKEEYLKAKGA